MSLHNCYAGWLDSNIVRNPKDRFSHDASKKSCIALCFLRIFFFNFETIRLMIRTSCGDEALQSVNHREIDRKLCQLQARESSYQIGNDGSKEVLKER